MFLALAHTKLDIYTVTRSFVRCCYMTSKLLPADERFNMVQQLRRSALSTQLNIAEGSSRKSEADRRRFYEIARGSLIEIDAILDAGEDLNYWNKTDLNELGEYILRVFQMLSKMIVYPS
jgi:four helix bundle protein